MQARRGQRIKPEAAWRVVQPGEVEYRQTCLHSRKVIFFYSLLLLIPLSLTFFGMLTTELCLNHDELRF